MGLQKRKSRVGILRRISFKALIGFAVLGLPALFGRPGHALTPDPALEAQRECLHARVARLRAVLEVEAGAVNEKEVKHQIAQWYNWGNWGNGWDNNWNNWPNRWFNS
jgi:hypothetical protein